MSAPLLISFYNVDMKKEKVKGLKNQNTRQKKDLTTNFIEAKNNQER